MPSISTRSVDLINSKLSQAKAIAILIQGNSSSEAPIEGEYIDSALSAVCDLIDCSYQVLNDDEKNSRGDK